MPVEWQVIGLLVAWALSLTGLFFQARNTTKADKKDERATLQEQAAAHEALVVRVVAMETKMGLLWGLVEDHMSKLILEGNPIELTPEELEAAKAYVRLKDRTATSLLRKLEYGIERELTIKSDIPADEIIGFTFLLSSIKSQLVDRGEVVERRVYAA